jgi:DNA-binding transcriptional LysR family regulator
MPSVFVQQDLHDGTLVRVLADYAPPPVEIHALYPSARFLASKVRLFLDFVRDEFLQIPALQVPAIKPKRVPRIRAKVAS